MVESGRYIEECALAGGYQVIAVSAQAALFSQISEINASGPYDGAILMTAFGAGPTNAPPPPGWDLKKTVREDWLIAYAIDSLKPHGGLVALVPNGLLSNYGRQGIRKGLI